MDLRQNWNYWCFVFVFSKWKKYLGFTVIGQSAANGQIQPPVPSFLIYLVVKADQSQAWVNSAQEQLPACQMDNWWICILFWIAFQNLEAFAAEYQRDFEESLSL